MVMKKDLHCKDCEMVGKSIFCQLEKESLNEVSTHKHISFHKKGEVIFAEGSDPEGLYCVHSGKVKLSSLSEQGKNSIISIVAGGGLIGHKSLFTNNPYPATATMLEDGQVCFLDKKFFFDFLKKEPTVSMELIVRLSKEIGAKNQSITGLTQKTVKARLAAYLLDAVANFGKPHKEGVEITVRLSREELASIVGTATETLIRLMSDFKENGYIKQEGKTIIVADIEGLKELALE